MAPTMTGTSDQDLRQAFDKLAAGDRDGLRDIWRGWHSKLYSYTLTLVGSRDEADDLLGDVMVKLSGQGRRLAKVTSPQAYLFRMVRNEALSLLRRLIRRRHVPWDEDGAGSEQTVDAVAVRQAVLGLPALQREVVALHAWGGLTFEQIGRVTSVSTNTAAGRYRYALAKLKQVLGDEERESQELGAQAAVGTSSRAGS